MEVRSQEEAAHPFVRQLGLLRGAPHHPVLRVGFPRRAAPGRCGAPLPSPAASLLPLLPRGAGRRGGPLQGPGAAPGGGDCLPSKGEERPDSGEAAAAAEAAAAGEGGAGVAAAQKAGEGVRLRRDCPAPAAPQEAQGAQGRRRGPLQDPSRTPPPEAQEEEDPGE